MYNNDYEKDMNKIILDNYSKLRILYGGGFQTGYRRQSLQVCPDLI